MSAAVTLALLFFLSVALNEQVTEGCRCIPKHPQQDFCTSDMVIRAKVTGEENSNNPYITGYNFQTIETFKQLNNKKIQVIYTSKSSCGLILENGEYLLSGRVRNGAFGAELCNRVKRWDSLSSVQKRYLSMYQKGCACEILPCSGASCLVKMLQKKCLMNVDDSSSLQDAFQSICLPDHLGFCSWQKPLVN